MAEKDPAFLFYPKDWFLDTSIMNLSEKGIFIDLLCFQHQNGYVPSDTKRLAMIVGLPENEFLEHWKILQPMFPEIDQGNFAKQFANQKLTKVGKQRSEHSQMRKVVGTFGAVLRAAELSDRDSAKIRKLFNHKEFLNVPEEQLTVLLTKWLANCLPNSLPNAHQTLEDGDAIGIEDAIGNANVLLVDRFKTFEFGQYAKHSEVILRLAKMIDEKCDRVQKLEKPLTCDEVCKIFVNNDPSDIKHILLAMQDRPDLHKKHISAYSTFNTWMRNELRRREAKGV